MVTSGESKALYPVAEYEDQKANEVSHVPYTRQYFHAMGTIIARRFYRIHTPPHKVIVLDCDNTLWEGVCGEDGASGVSVGPAYRGLQEFIIAQRDAGMLVCLCSKNNEEDVWSVFEKNSGMVLKREHFVSSRINWQPKSENLRSLSAELQLGLDSFIFLDDSAVECAEVEARCPEALTLQLPEENADFKRFLSHVWAFDHLKVTEEDRKRSDFYAKNAEREQLSAQSMRLEDFLAGLELQLEFLPMTRAELPRVAQITQRTNQFNFTSVRRTENEVEQLCYSGECGVPGDTTSRPVWRLRTGRRDDIHEASRPAGCGQRAAELPRPGKAGRASDAFAFRPDCVAGRAREDTNQLCPDSEEQTSTRLFRKHWRNHSGRKRSPLSD